jgi:beta-glucosidase-like glycosyl hydrolase
VRHTPLSTHFVEVNREKKTKINTTEMMGIRVVLLVTIAVVVDGLSAGFPDCKAGPLSTFPICDQSIPTHQRAADLVSRMTTAEKITQMVHQAAAIPRLGLPNYDWWSEALHGVCSGPGATSFPQVINLGATFNMSLVHHIASVISTEARALNNAGHTGLTFYAPNVNIFRDPRWGRGQETPGEDPYLSAQYAYTFVNGMQRGDDDRYLKVVATCKHYDAYDLENSDGTDRHHFNAIVNDQDLVETYLPPFESCIRDARVASIMCSYNAIDGIPACANKFLLQTIAR